MDYEGSNVFNLNAKQARAVLSQNDFSQAFNAVQDPHTMQWTSHHLVQDAPKFVVFYKPGCPFCDKMHQAWIDLADKAVHEKLPVNVMAINREDNINAIRHFRVMSYPSIRLYKGSSD